MSKLTLFIEIGKYDKLNYLININKNIIGMKNYFGWKIISI
jgi:hypothetical protein